MEIPSAPGTSAEACNKIENVNYLQIQQKDKRKRTYKHERDVSVTDTQTYEEKLLQV